MKILSLTEPWATLLVHGHKKIETRSWTPPRGIVGKRIGIHASKGFPRWAKDTCLDFVFHEALKDLPEFNLGCIIGTIHLMGARRTDDVRHQLSEPELSFGDYADGRWAWFMSDPVLLETPIPAVGHLGLWNFEHPDLVVKA